MKKEQLYEVLGEIDETYINNAKSSKKGTIMWFAKSTWLKFGSMAACFCLIVLAAVFVLNNNTVSGPMLDLSDNYANTISYVGWTDNSALYKGALNYELLKNEPDEHLPIFKIDTMEELENFKETYSNILLFDQGYDTVKSFSEAMGKAQFDREIFYEERSLLIIYIPASSGSFRYAIHEVKTENASLCIEVEQANDPEVITEDMAGWLLLVCVHDVEISKYTSIDAKLSK